MENSLKQRIVGAIVLIALAVIFLPAILKEKTQRAPFQSQIPSKPLTITSHKISESDTLKNKEIVGALDQQQSQAENIAKSVQSDSLPITTSIDKKASSTIADKPNIEPAVVEESKPISADPLVAKEGAWVIQVASFSNLDNADKLIDKLQAQGHKAYRRDETSNNKSIHRIFVGPYIEKQKAEKQLKSINQLSQSKALILSFDPIQH